MSTTYIANIFINNYFIFCKSLTTHCCICVQSLSDVHQRPRFSTITKTKIFLKEKVKFYFDFNSCLPKVLLANWLLCMFLFVNLLPRHYLRFIILFAWGASIAYVLAPFNCFTTAKFIRYFCNILYVKYFSCMGSVLCC